MDWSLITKDPRFYTIVINAIGLIGIILTATSTIGEPEWVKYQAGIQAIINVFLPSPIKAQDDTTNTNEN